MTIDEYRHMTSRKRPDHPEHDLQADCMRWFWSEYPQYEPFLFAIPNGGHRNITTARMLKEEGVKSGVPDLEMALPAHGYHGLFLELKNGHKNQLTSNQKRLMRAYTEAGFLCVVIRTQEEFEDVVREYLDQDNTQLTRIQEVKYK